MHTKGTFNISIHALREEGDATADEYGISRFISIHALREEGDFGYYPVRCQFLISIHALREEGDMTGHKYSTKFKKFLSTPSARRATYTRPNIVRRLDISIHALREEGD